MSIEYLLNYHANLQMYTIDQYLKGYKDLQH